MLPRSRYAPRVPPLRAALVDPRWRRRALTLVLVAALTTVPLLGSLGYEHAFVLAPLFSLLGMAVGVDAMHRIAGSKKGSRWDLGVEVLRELSILHGLAVLMTLLGGLWQRGCDPWGGLLFYGMGPALASLLGAISGVWGGLLAKRRARAIGLAFLPMAYCIVVGLWRLYAQPVVYAFDPFFGYFSGSVYDEAVRITDRYVEYRGYTLLGGLTGVLAFVMSTKDTLGWRNPLQDLEQGRRRLLGVCTIAAGITTLSIAAQAAHLGFTADEQSIREQLSLRHETEHFIIDYAPRSPDDRTIELIAAEHEFAYDRLKRLMGGLEPEGKVHSFVFRDRDQKRRAMGAGTVQVAAPWRRQIYLDHRGFPHPVLHHELAHIFGAAVGDDLFGVARSGFRLNIGLIEGFATGMAPRPADRLDLHDQVEALTALKRRPALSAIMGPGFLSQSSRVAYTTAGSFVLWLVETRGFEPMGVFYGTAGDAQAAYGTSLEDLEAQWLAFLDQRKGIRPQDVEAQAQRFKRGSVFERPCAHKVAEVRGELRKAAGKAQFDDVVRHHRRLCALEPLQPAHKLGLAIGHIEQRDLDAALATLEEIAAMPDLTVSILSRMHELRGDTHLYSGDMQTAAAAYAVALALPGDEGHTRVLELKLEATEDAKLAEIVRDYLNLFETDGDGFSQGIARLAAAHRIRALPAYAALGDYLVARQLLNVQRPADALSHLEAVYADLEGLPSDTFRRAARHELMSVRVQLRDYAGASRLLDELEADDTIGNGHRLEYAYWRERIEFFRDYRPATPAASVR